MKEDAKTQAARTAVSGELDKLVKVHGFSAVRAACNRYLKTAQARAKAKKEIARLEKELQDLRAKA